jgi:hypothetical protein
MPCDRSDAFPWSDVGPGGRDGPCGVRHASALSATTRRRAPGAWAPRRLPRHHDRQWGGAVVKAAAMLCSCPTEGV